MANPVQDITPAYAALSAAHIAGFKGWPLAIMTAISARESSFSPTASDPGDPCGGSYGLWQINGSHNVGGQATSQWITKMYDPVANAKQAYALAGGNSLSGLSGAWALQWDGENKKWPSATYTEGLVNGVETPINYNLTLQEKGQAAAAYATYLVFGALSQTELNQIPEAGWKGSSPTATLTDTTGGGSAGGGSNGCDPDKYLISYGGVVAGIGSVHIFSYCQLKAIKSAACMVAGATVMAFGLSILIKSTSLGGKVSGAAGAVIGGVGALPFVGGTAKKAAGGAEPESHPQTTIAQRNAWLKQDAANKKAQEDSEWNKSHPFED